MKQSSRIVGRALFALGVLGALAFGAAEGLAAPRGEADAARPYCDPVKCNAACGGYGICSGWQCLCA